MKKGGTIQRAGCLVTGCLNKIASEAVVLGQWPHQSEVMRVSVTTLPIKI